ncbi:7-deoxyloganetin glucosyltransferase-like [Olea europaea subsp. europaea]|uniref:7-deoxyloganetin glucosyltransferase n=1 Tax=Olea europaea subsp. europaea TaxID=158383 RepID=A0A8S0UXJ4_OLEEU|nr:7-deoxyloganetin glucosyltransferase-like [Olea europaea subsp. europaea]
MDSVSLLEKPHVVCIPFPAQGHINPMFKLAKLLHQKGFHVTFVNTEFNHVRLLKCRGPDSLKGLASSRFETIPDGLPISDADVTQDIPFLCESTTNTCLAPFKDLLARLNDTVSLNVLPVSCVISDGVMSFTLEAAEELGIPEVLFWTISACGFLAYTQYAKLIEEGYVPLKDEIPGMEGIRLKDMPSFIRTTSLDEYMVKFLIQETERARRASAIILNTFEDLEYEYIKTLLSILPPVYAVGPLHFLQKYVKDKCLEILGSNLWKEDLQCLEWLDSKEPNSVIYVNFGSITVMTAKQLIEFAWGLVNSNQTFLWIIRPDLFTGDDAILPTEFLEATRERGMLANWCPQEKVLSHPSIRGFLTHRGWNSTLESIGSGVPVICWPFFAEQPTNCWFSCTKWGIGMEIDSDVKRDEVEILVNELMIGDKGKEMKKRALELMKLAQDSVKNFKRIILQESGKTNPLSSSLYKTLYKLIGVFLEASFDTAL